MEKLEFQKKITHLLNQERERLKKKEIVVKDTENEIKVFEQRRNTAFEFLDSAIDFFKQEKYDETITAYQNAANIFAEIQWTEEIPLIEDSIREVENLQRQQKIEEQKRFRAAIEREKEEVIYS